MFISHLDKDDMEEMDIKWNMSLLGMRADRFWKKTGKKISIQGTDVAEFDKSKVECFNNHKMGHFARECRAPRSQYKGRRDNYRQGFMANEEEDHALVANEETPTEFALMAKTSADSEVEARLVEFKNKEVKYCEKIRGLEFKIESRGDRIECLTNELELLKKEKGRNPSVTKIEASPSTISPKPFIKFVKGELKKLEQSEVPTVRLGVKKGRLCPKNNCSNKSMTPRTVIRKPYRPPIRPVRPNMNVAQPKKTSFHKLAHSYSKRPFQRTSAVRSEFRAPWIPTVNRKFSTVNRKFPTVNRKFSTGSTKFSTADMGKKGNAVKASACWIWKPRHNTTNKGQLPESY
nr:hypothetical protein [Tanacetum cinerariifolium]